MLCLAHRAGGCARQAACRRADPGARHRRRQGPARAPDAVARERPRAAAGARDRAHGDRPGRGSQRVPSSRSSGASRSRTASTADGLQSIAAPVPDAVRRRHGGGRARRPAGVRRGVTARCGPWTRRPQLGGSGSRRPVTRVLREDHARARRTTPWLRDTTTSRAVTTTPAGPRCSRPRASRPGLRGARLLDVACGTGNTMLPMLARGYEVTGVDISRGHARRGAAQDRGPRAPRAPATCAICRRSASSTSSGAWATR